MSARSVIRLLTAIAALLICVEAQAQVRPERPVRRPPRDTAAVRDSTARPDSIARPDSVPVAEADTALPLPLFRDIFGAVPAGVAASTFVWDREALLREAAVSLADLLERIPGMTGIRAGQFLQPEAVTAFGQTRGRIEFVVDGFVLDPLFTSTLDIAQIEVINLVEVRVERRLDVTRVHLSTAEALETRPYSRVEAGTGEPDGSAFRGIFLAPHVIVGPLALAIDRVDSDGPARAQPADILGVWGKWQWLGGNGGRGLQLEFRQNRLRRQGGVPWIADGSRRDVVLRARQRLGGGVGAELFAGHTWTREQRTGETPEDTVVIEREQLQYGALASFRRNQFWLDAEARFRDSEALPQRQFDVSAGLRPFRYGALAGTLSQLAWKDEESALSWNVRGELGPVGGLGIFGELSDGERGAPLWADSLGVPRLEAHTLDERKGSRAGVRLNRFGIDLTAAYVKLEAPRSAPFGLPFDSALVEQGADPVEGFEVYGRLPLWPRFLTLDASFNSWSDVAGWLYLPTRNWRVGVELHALPLASRNLEFFGRVESQRRGIMRVPDPAGDLTADPPVPLVTNVEAEQMINAYLQIRVIDVRAYIHWYDILAARRLDLPGREITGRRIFYGVKWQLFN